MSLLDPFSAQVTANADRSQTPESSVGRPERAGRVSRKFSGNPCWWRHQAWCNTASPTPLIFSVFTTVHGVNFGHPCFPPQPPTSVALVLEPCVGHTADNVQAGKACLCAVHVLHGDLTFQSPFSYPFYFLAGLSSCVVSCYIPIMEAP